MRYRTCIQYYNVYVFFECFPVCVVCRVFVCVCVRVCLGIHLNSYAANIYRFFFRGHLYIPSFILPCSLVPYLWPRFLEPLEKAKTASSFCKL